MSREIKFRGKRIDNGQWVYGDLIKQSIIDPFTYIAKGTGYKVDDKEIGKPLKVYPSSVGQLTGLKDKTKTCIYEGDIVRVLEGDAAMVIFANGAFMLEYIGIDVYRDLLGWLNFKLCHQHDENSFEIIGNIHENPELLTATKP